MMVRRGATSAYHILPDLCLESQGMATKGETIGTSSVMVDDRIRSTVSISGGSLVQKELTQHLRYTDFQNGLNLRQRKEFELA